MVGSGFSRNAQKTRFDSTSMPLWTEIAEEFYRHLYPEKALGIIPSVDNVLRLAQEYQTAFGQSDLYRQLDQLIQDNNFAPGELHLRLLRLPWRDVFTTNWDTLLERASAEIPERPYNVVQNMAQLPLVSQPRIIKLHGSFPSQFPLVITEEQYRNYPNRFAPFVNTVQQAMMETIFCLIGFSGTDPNFLNWTGWVRDNLGEAAPKIYLAGWLGLSPHRRRMLETRGVVPIDLANHPQAQSWPANRRYQYATEWLLHSLEPSRPYDKTTWPLPSEQDEKPIPDHLQPVEKIISNVPMQELGKLDNNEPPERIRQVINIWSYNRHLYPGWLVFPSGQEFSQRTNQWEQPILNALSDFSPTERLCAIRELVWRREIMLEPIVVDVETAANDVLNRIDCNNYTIDGVEVTRDDWTNIREAWKTVALALVTDARLECNRQSFDMRIDALLLSFINDDPEVEHRIQQERCLWAAYSLDFDQLNQLLDEWKVENCDPAWLLRKAALLTEACRCEESVHLIQDALQSLRKDSAIERNISNASREGWALASTLEFNNRQNVLRAWDNLASQKCDPQIVIDHIRRTISGTAEREEAPLFDVGRRPGTGFRWSHASTVRLISAYRAIRLPEVTGLPPTNNPGDGGVPVSMVSDLLMSAADELVVNNPRLAMRLVLRFCKFDRNKTLQRVLSRKHLAKLDDESIAEVAQICIDVIRYALPRLDSPGQLNHGISWIERMRVALEILSRLVLRLSPSVVNEALDIGLECYRQNRVVRHIWLMSPLCNLLRRTWDALPQNGRTSRVFELLLAPMVGLDGFAADESWLDPGRFISENDLPSGHPSNEKRYREAVKFLMRGLHGGDAAQKRATSRLLPLALAKVFTEEEASSIADSLWGNSDGVLANTSGAFSVLDWVFLVLPEKELGQAERSFRQKWLTPNSDDQSADIDYSSDVLVQVDAAIAAMAAQGVTFSLTDEEEVHISSHIVQLVEMFSSETVRFNLGVETKLVHVGSLGTLISIPKQVAEDLFHRVESLLSQDIRQGNFGLESIRVLLGYAIIPCLAKAMPGHVDTLIRWLRTGLASEESTRISGTFAALRSWLSAPKSSELRPIPDDLMREVGIVIASDRRAALADALICAKQIFDDGSQSHRETLIPLVLQGLVYLAERLQYDSDHGDEELPTLRFLCARIATSVARLGYKEDATIAMWLDISRRDPFPEVRNVVMSLDAD